MGSGNGGTSGGFFLTGRQKGAIMGAAGLIGAIVVIWNFAGQVADALPFADKSTVMRLAGEVRDIQKQNVLDQMRLNRQLRYDNLAEQEKYKKAGSPVPQIILRDSINLEEEANQLERELNRLENVSP